MTEKKLKYAFSEEMTPEEVVAKWENKCTWGCSRKPTRVVQIYERDNFGGFYHLETRCGYHVDIKNSSIVAKLEKGKWI